MHRGSSTVQKLDYLPWHTKPSDASAIPPSNFILGHKTKILVKKLPSFPHFSVPFNRSFSVFFFFYIGSSGHSGMPANKTDVIREGWNYIYHVTQMVFIFWQPSLESHKLGNNYPVWLPRGLNLKAWYRFSLLKTTWAPAWSFVYIAQTGLIINSVNLELLLCRSEWLLVC